MQRACLLFCFLCLSVLAGCVTKTPEDDSAFPSVAIKAEIGNEDTEAIATDLVSVFMQIPGFDPWSTTLQFSPLKTSFGEAIHKTFISAGFGIQMVANDQGLNYVSYRQGEYAEGTETRLFFSLSVRNVEVTREYQIADGRPFPASPVNVTGTEPSNILVNDDIYRQRGGSVSFSSGVVFNQANGEKLQYNTRRVKVTDRSRRPKEQLFSHQRFLVVAKSRIFLNTKLNSTTDVRDWSPVRQVTLRFPGSDTSYIGNRNKRAIARMLAGYNSDLHGFSITGCSHTRSLMWDGTEGASLDRQDRIKQELLVSGIGIDRIREYGCFRGAFNEDLPKRAVILTMHQKTPNS